MQVKTKPKVRLGRLDGPDGNVFAVMGNCKTAAKKAGWSQETIEELLKEMMSGDYDNLLSVAHKYFDVR